MGSMRVFVTAFLLLAFVVATATEATVTVSCDAVAETLLPCAAYLVFPGTGEIFLRNCCNNLIEIQREPDRQGVCSCIKSALVGVTPENLKLLASLPGLCSVDLTYNIDSSTDCDSI